MAGVGRSAVSITALMVVVFVFSSLAGVAGAWDGEAVAAKPELAVACALLDDDDVRQRMDGLLVKLLIMCDRTEELGLVHQQPAQEPIATEAGGVDIPVNDPGGDTSVSSHTQSETSMVVNEVTGTICAGYNDSWHYFAQSDGFTGFSRSTDGGATFSDQGALGNNSFGDPSVVWRRLDGHLYFAALHSNGLGVWRSTDDCQSFNFLGMIHSGFSDDKELMAVDNNPASPHYGRLYVQWTDFGTGGLIRSTYSDNGTTWSSPVNISTPGADVQGVWPVVAPNGDVYASWVRDRSSGPIDIEVVRSTDGGATFGFMSNPITDKVLPRDAAATGNCGRVALRGNIRYLPSPQIAVGTDGVLHVVYSYDPDGANSGDVVDVFYRRSTDGGVNWQDEVRLNDDATTNDQFFPTLSVGANNIVSTTWYDRREDPGNLLFKYYQRISYDGGVTWGPSEAVSDVASPVYLDPNLATCYHGDYDTHVQTGTHAVAQWSDDRNIQSGHNDPDVYADQLPVSDDFLVLADPPVATVCAPDDGIFTIDVPQFSGFSEPVTLATGPLTPGLSADFSVNPVTPPGSSQLTLSGTGAAGAGTHDVDITGTSAPSAVVHETSIALVVFDALPASPALVAPVNGASNQPSKPHFQWAAAAQGGTYRLQVATDAGFAGIVLDAADISDVVFTPATDLDTNTVFFWRVSSTNACGEGPWSAVWSFVTEALPGDCAMGTQPEAHFFDNFETGSVGWTHAAFVGSDTWALGSGVSGPHSGASVYHVDDVPDVSDQYLVSPAVELPVEGVPITLQFWTYQALEDTGSGCYDGGILEISTDDGGSWLQLQGATVLLTDPYDGAISSCCSNPLQNLQAWCGDPQDWLKSVVALDAYAGETVRFRFRLGTDSSVDHPGWDIDDVEVRSCVEVFNPDVFQDGFESGDTSSWSATVP